MIMLYTYMQSFTHRIFFDKQSASLFDVVAQQQSHFQRVVSFYIIQLLTIQVLDDT